MYLTSGDVGLASGMAGTRSSHDRTRSLSICWPCFLVYRLCSQENFLCMVIKVPLTMQYYPYSLLILEKKNMNPFLHGGNQVLEEVPHWPDSGPMAIPSPLGRAREIEYTGRTWIICLLLVPGCGVSPAQITLQKHEPATFETIIIPFTDMVPEAKSNVVT